MNYFQFQKQYILSQHYLPISIEGWKTKKLGDWNLAFDTQLEISESKKGDLSLVLLGFAVHIHDYTLNETDILGRLLQYEEVFFDELDALCGVFVLFKLKDNLLEAIFHDACGIMRVNYLIDDIGTVKAIGFDAKLIAHFFDLKLKEDTSAISFYQSKKYNKSGIELGNQTKFEKLFQLLPNHYLCFNKHEAIRYFPREPLEKISLKEGITRLSRQMISISKGFNRKWNRNVLSITAGWDSRVVLAANKSYRDKIKCFLFIKSDKGGYSVDKDISTKIASSMDLDFKILDVRGPKDEKLKVIVKSSLTDISKQNLENLLNGLRHFDPKDLLVLGFLSEITKVYFGSFTIRNGEDFVFISKFPQLDYCSTYFDQYIQKHKQGIVDLGYNFNDIAHWEQDAFNFAARRMSVYNTYTHAISPFNNRVVLNTILGVKAKYRGDFKNKFFRLFIKANWPELLNYPINPVFIKYWMNAKRMIGVSGLMKRFEYFRFKRKIWEYKKN